MDIDGIAQIQANSDIGLTFAAALRSILRQDPDIIMIGEIRDTETAKIAVRSSITGHLVLSTLHTNNSLNTIERLLDMEVERYLLASSLEGIISQKLARRLCPKCKKLRKTNEYEKDLFKKILDKDVEEIYSAEGCEVCGNGYKGRIAIHEVLKLNQDIRDAISENIRRDLLRDLVYKSDVTTLLQDGLEKVLEGHTTFEELLKLIELDDDDKGAGLYDLKTALEQTNLHNKKKDAEEPNPEVKEEVKSEVKTEPAPSAPNPVATPVTEEKVEETVTPVTPTSEVKVEPTTEVTSTPVAPVTPTTPVTPVAEPVVATQNVVPTTIAE